MHRFTHASIASAAAVLLAGCSDMARLVSPAGSVDMRPARVGVTASVASSASRSAADIVGLRVTSSYLESDGTRTTIGTQSIALSSATTQALPIPVDLAGCLADGNREGASSDASCTVFLELALSVNAVVVDRQTVGPLRLAPGATTNVSQPVALFEIASLEIAPSAPLALTLGASATITPTIRDARGQPVGDRIVTWASDAPTIATVDANGRVSAVGVGSARITATLESFSNAVNVVVSRPPVALLVAPSAGSGNGVVRSTPAGIDCRVLAGAVSGVCAFDFAADALVTLTSTADPGQQFAAWGGACVGQAVSSTCQLTMAQPRTASAQFVALRRVSVASIGDDGRGRVSGGFGIDCRVDGSATSGACVANVPDGTPITLTALPDPANAVAVAQVFAGWGGACASATNATCTITPSGADRTASAGFHDGRTLTVTLSGAGGGRVSSVTGIACTRTGDANAGVCAQTLSHGTSVTLFPVPDDFSEFTGWGGACAGQALGMCTLDLSQARAVTATFASRRVPLTLRLTGSGDGSITVNGATACARTAAQQGVVECVRLYEFGALVTVQGAPGAQTEFVGLGGDCTGAGVCTLVMSTARTVTSAFEARGPMRLTVEPRGTSGSGTVRSTEAVPLIDCTITNGVATSGRCSATVASGSSITLRATGAINNAHAFWGAGCNGRTTFECTIVMDVPIDVFVGFTNAIDVEMRMGGTGLGSVTFAPEGAPAQAPCVIGVAGAAVSCRFSLPASSASGVFRGLPSGGSSFAGFVGPCAESSGANSVPVCTYRGIGFLRVITATFND